MTRLCVNLVSRKLFETIVRIILPEDTETGRCKFDMFLNVDGRDVMTHYAWAVRSPVLAP